MRLCFVGKRFFLISDFVKIFSYKILFFYRRQICGAEKSDKIPSSPINVLGTFCCCLLSSIFSWFTSRRRLQASPRPPSKYPQILYSSIFKRSWNIFLALRTLFLSRNVLRFKKNRSTKRLSFGIVWPARKIPQKNLFIH